MNRRMQVSAVAAAALLAASWVTFAQQPAAKPPASPPASGSPAAGSASAPGGKTQPGQSGTGAPASGAPGASTPGAPGAAGTTDNGQAMGDIDQILEGDEDVLAGNGYSYDPGNRRDPFKSLLAGPDRREFRGPRPEGVPGLLIDEIDLKGIYRTGKGYVAQVTAANQKKSYLLKEGDQLYDGDVVSIGRSEVVFKQIVNDPAALKPFREVVKSLNPT